MERTISAPGKLFLSGEYAVLWGGVARVMATGARNHAFVRARADRRVHVLLAEGRLSGSATPLGVHWDETPPQAFQFVAHTLDLALRVLGHETPGFSIAFEPSSTVSGHKLGFGSSARACVLAAEGVRSALGATTDTLKLALVAHASAQGGKGSGADVAAAFAGGVIRYRTMNVSALIDASNRSGFGAALERLPPVDIWRVAPPRLPMLYVFSGESASTPKLVSSVERSLDAEARAQFVLESDRAGLALEEGLARGEFGAVLEATKSLQALLFSLGVTRTPALERTLALAESLGCVAKQSGAGGGDGCIVFAPNVQTLQLARGAFESRSMLALEVDPEPGLRGEIRPHAQLMAWSDAAS